MVTTTINNIYDENKRVVSTEKHLTPPLLPQINTAIYGLPFSLELRTVGAPLSQRWTWLQEEEPLTLKWKKKSGSLHEGLLLTHKIRSFVSFSVIAWLSVVFVLSVDLWGKGHLGPTHVCRTGWYILSLLQSLAPRWQNTLLF